MQTERRKHHQLRALFDEAYERVEPCLAAASPKGMPVEWLVFRKARAADPQLSTLELFMLAMASQRVYRSRHAPRQGRLAF